MLLKNNLKSEHKSWKEFSWKIMGKIIIFFHFLNSVSLNDPFMRWIMLFAPE